MFQRGDFLLFIKKKKGGTKAAFEKIMQKDLNNIFCMDAIQYFSL